MSPLRMMRSPGSRGLGAEVQDDHLALLGREPREQREALGELPGIERAVAGRLLLRAPLRLGELVLECRDLAAALFLVAEPQLRPCAQTSR